MNNVGNKREKIRQEEEKGKRHLKLCRIYWRMKIRTRRKVLIKRHQLCGLNACVIHSRFLAAFLLMIFFIYVDRGRCWLYEKSNMASTISKWFIG